MTHLARWQGQLSCSQILELPHLHPGHQNQLYCVAQARCLTQVASGGGRHSLYTKATAGQMRCRACSNMFTNSKLAPPPPPGGDLGPTLLTAAARDGCKRGVRSPQHRAWTSAWPQVATQTKDIHNVFGGNKGLEGQHTSSSNRTRT